MSPKNTNTDILLVSGNLSHSFTKLQCSRLTFATGRRFRSIYSRYFGLPIGHYQDTTAVSRLQKALHKPFDQCHQSVSLSRLISGNWQRCPSHNSILLALHSPCNQLVLTHIAKQEHSSPPTKAPRLYSVIRPYQPQYHTQSLPQSESSYHASSLPQRKCSNRMPRWYLGPKAPLVPTRSSMAMLPFLH